MPNGIAISIICATRNAEGSLTVFLESYVAARTDETELVIVDACSTDSTPDVLRKYESHIACLIVEPDRSIYDAWNKGIRRARGKFVCFIGADDRIAPGAIEALLAVIRGNGAVDYVHGRNIMMKSGRISGLIGRPYGRDTIEKYLPMAHVMSAHRRNWVIENGGFEASYRSSGDYDFLLRMRKTMRMVDCQTILAYVEDAGISRNSTLPIFESFRSRRKNGVAMTRNLIWTARGLIGYLCRKWASYIPSFHSSGR